MRKLLLLFTFLFVVINLQAQLRLAAIFDDHMVLQQQSPVPIWGWSYSTQDISIKVSWDTTTVKVKTDNTAFWGTTLFTPVAGGPHTITVTAGGETVTLSDVMTGEVWFCAGQSNMEWSMDASADGRTDVANVNDPNIRLFDVPNSAAITPQVRGEGTWKVANAANVKSFSAVAYYFGKKLNTNLNVPIGLINVSWGGTPAETWLPREIVEGNPELKASAAKQIDDKPWCPSSPGVVYNSMVNPMLPFRIAGALWYQGEANTAAPSTYKLLMENVVTEWRKHFLHDFPFYYVQIAPFSGYGGSSGTLVREQQVKMLEIAKSGMVVVSDLVDDVKDIHPKYKKPVGERLANLALADTYGKKGIVYLNPLYKEAKEEKGKLRIAFHNIPTGLMAKGKEVTEFMVAGEDKKFYPAKAVIDGNTVVVSAKEVKKPVAVRFGWSNGSIPNLFSKEGLPVSSFRSDNWAE
ncbi:sialate O-acetylesterase [Chryseolinea lacunae]|uniref:Sialate O-acetylesterase n=1 Tax=Chryseolinea lacunae TaxID=2801331 RepID=A0ABS1KT71_9BACT|nr:sialate O-acetylesterase [Chryseolinea lacunae]MBL0742668.1 sialate O-acetylesterase [Chryseolinea lacunae]